MKHPRSYAPPAAAAAANSIEDGLAVYHHHHHHPVRSQRYDDDPDDKRRGRRWRHRPGAGAGGRMLLLLLAAVVVFGGRLLWSRAGLDPEEEEPTLVRRARAATTEAFAGANVKTLVQQGMGLAGPKGRAEAKEEEREEEDTPEQGQQMARATRATEKKEEEPLPLPQNVETWTERQASGRHVLATGVDVALQELMETRGFANASLVQTPNFEGALSFFVRAAELFSQTYDGQDEVIESDYFDAIELQALLRLYQGKCLELDALLDEAQRKIDLDPQERSAIALLRGYCEEQQGSSKAGMYFSLAREYDPEGCHETLLDATYQPATYGLSTRLPPREDGYWEHLIDLLVFRQLYTHRARLANEGSTWPGSLWAPEPQRAGDEYGANLGWGMNGAGVARAGEILRGQDFVVLREFLHPFELAVLERYYRAKAPVLPFDPNLGRISSYQDRVGMWLNHRMTQLVASFVGRPLKHAYSFLCHYEKKDGVIPTLTPHTDREDNQYTVSIQIYSDKEEPLWPIYVHAATTLPEHSSWRPLPPKEDSVECGVRNGDALLFLGRRHIHYREDMPPDLNVVASLLLHFVDKEMDLFAYKIRQAADPSI